MPQRSVGCAPVLAARTLHVSGGTHLMSAAHIASDDFEVDVHLDSAGDRFGALARGGSRRRVLVVGYFCETVARIEDGGTKAL